MRPIFLVILILACFSTLFLCCYAPALLEDRQFGFRDAGHYYYPLHARVQNEWNAGRTPLWEPEENGGMPLLGNPTAAVLYPGKAIFAVLPYKWGARIYIVAHSVLAFAAMLCLMRSLGVGWAGSGVGALSYTFGAPILFQYCNIIYLVGAAWLPLGVRAVDRWVRLGRRWAILELALVLGMQVLGGDPQVAFLLGIAGLSYSFALARSRARVVQERVLENQESEPRTTGGNSRTLVATVVLVVAWFVTTVFLGVAFPKLRPPFNRPPTPPLPWIGTLGVAVMLLWLSFAGICLYRWRGRPWRSPLGAIVLGLAIAAAIASAVTAAQLFPVVEFTQQTTRASEGGTHELYAFSIEPHRFIEMIWPNIWGAQFGGNTYWAGLIRLPGSYPKIWVPSLYVGVLTFVLVLPAFALRRGPPWRVWLSYIAIVSCVGALGQYTSPIWITRGVVTTSRSAEIRKLAADLGPLDAFDATPIRKDGYLRDGDGSIYWLIATFLPGFRQFRFPAKLFTFTVLAMSVLAGAGWERVCAGRNRVVTVCAVVLIAVSACLLAGVLAQQRAIVTTLQSINTSTMFGPLDVRGAVRAIIRALVHAIAALALGLVLIKAARKRPGLAGALLVVLISVDLGVANTRFIFTVPQSSFESKPEVLELIQKEERERPEPGPFRVHRMPLWNPPAWNFIPSPDRVTDFVTWERGTLQPKYGIDLGVEYTHTFGVAELYDYEWFFSGFPRTVRDVATARSLGVDPGSKVLYYPRRGFDIWNTRYFVLPCYTNGWNDEQRATAAFLYQVKQVYPKKDQFTGPGGIDENKQWVFTQDYQVLRNEQAYPRAWVVHRARAVAQTVGLSRETRRGAIEEILYPNDHYWYDDTKVSFDPRDLAWVSGDDISEVRPKLSDRLPANSEKVTVTYPTPTQVVLEVDVESPGLVVLADIHYPGWELEIDGKPAKIYRVNQLMRGALVPANPKHHRLVYTFAPQSFRIGVVVSCAGLAIVLFFGIFCCLRPVDPMLAAGSAGDRRADHTGHYIDRSNGAHS